MRFLSSERLAKIINEIAYTSQLSPNEEELGKLLAICKFVSKVCHQPRKRLIY